MLRSNGTAQQMHETTAFTTEASGQITDPDGMNESANISERNPLGADALAITSSPSSTVCITGNMFDIQSKPNMIMNAAYNSMVVRNGDDHVSSAIGVTDSSCILLQRTNVNKLQSLKNISAMSADNLCDYNSSPTQFRDLYKYSGHQVWKASNSNIEISQGKSFINYDATANINPPFQYRSDIPSVINPSYYGDNAAVNTETACRSTSLPFYPSHESEHVTLYKNESTNTSTRSLYKHESTNTDSIYDFQISSTNDNLSPTYIRKQFDCSPTTFESSYIIEPSSHIIQRIPSAIQTPVVPFISENKYPSYPVSTVASITTDTFSHLDSVYTETHLQAEVFDDKISMCAIPSGSSQDVEISNKNEENGDKASILHIQQYSSNLSLSTTSKVNHNAPSPLPHQKKSKKESLEAKREKKAAKTLAIITGAFVVCWLPFFVIALVMSFCPECWMSNVVFSFFLWLGYFNSTLNPIIYTIFSPEFREAFKRILCGRKTQRYRPGKYR